MTAVSVKKPKPPGKASKAKKALSPEEKARKNLQRRHRKEIREIFDAAGFHRAEKASDQEFKFNSFTSDFDDIFILENIVVLAEYTITKESEISSHLKPKSLLYQSIIDNQSSFIEFAAKQPLDIGGKLNQKYAFENYRIVILYCSYNEVKKELKEQVVSPVYMDYGVVRYFRTLSKTTKLSSKHELLAFLGIDSSEFAERSILSNPPPKVPFDGSVLPESHSKFPKGYKVVSFYINPAALLSRAYVLRRDGWRERTGLYQRMIDRRKVESIRKYLVDQQRVFVNNIIVTLPEDTKILDSDGNTVNPSTIQKTQSATILITDRFNSIGLIDGQHRVFSYHEGGTHEVVINNLRNQQNLLVTGIIYPNGVPAEEKTRFEASLFLEINSKQTNAKSELIQGINQLIRPFSTDSIAREVLEQINDGKGALAGKFARHYFETEKIKTTSVVSYGLRPLIRPAPTGPIFSRWNDPDKDTFIAQENDAARLRYIAHCASQISTFISAAKSQLPTSRWTTDKKVPNNLLTPTIINGLVGTLRQVIEADIDIEFEAIQSRLKGLDSFEFEKYKSSQYTVMASDLFKKYFV